MSLDKNFNANILSKLGRSNFFEIGSGMEGMIFGSQNSNEIVKIWNSKTLDHLLLLKKFYASFNNKLNGIQTPFIKEIHQYNGQSVTIEKRLPGTALSNLISLTDPLPSNIAVKALIKAFSEMELITEETMKALPILNDTKTFWSKKSWSESIMSNIKTKRFKFTTQLDRDIKNLDIILDAIHAFLQNRSEKPLNLIHGDLFPENIHVFENGYLSSILDFGFMSTLGDPAFDVSISSAIYNMYNSCASKHDDFLVDILVDQLGHDKTTLLAYRAVYALLTSHAYDPSGEDGHYKWCIKMINRSDVQSALGL